MPRKIIFLTMSIVSAGSLNAQSQSSANPPNVSQVLMYSTLTNVNVGPNGSQSPTSNFTPTAAGNYSALLSVYTVTPTVTANSAATNFLTVINNPQSYSVAQNGGALSAVLGSNIALSLGTLPLESPTSGVILKTDPSTGAPLPVSGTLGPIFTQRAETIGKHKFYFGVTHQNYHFTSLDGHSLNGLAILYGGNDPSGVQKAGAPTTTSQATFNLGLDVRLSQDVAFLTYGLTNRIDVSVGLPMVHAAVASTAYNGISYSGTGTFAGANSQCWCINTFAPGTFALTQPTIGQSSLGKTGFGDMVIRVKGTVLENPHAVLAIGADLRPPTGDAANYLGTGTTSFKPFLALSLFSKPLAHGIVFAPHMEVAWQYSGKSILGGELQGTSQIAQLSGNVTAPFYGTPLIATKDYLPDVFSWSAGTEVALGRSHTIVLDVLGNQIGLVHGALTLDSVSNFNAFAQPTLASSVPTSAFAAAGRTSFGQYSGAFGYKTRIYGNLIASFQALVRFDNNGLTARVVPLYGLGYSF